MTKISVDTYSKPRHSSLPHLAVVMLILLSGTACGKIGPLRLSEKPMPGPVINIVVQQRQNDILLSWSFPKTLMDKKTAFQADLVRFVEIWHTDKTPGKIPFSKLAKRQKRLSLKDLVKEEDNRYTLELPFPAKQLDSKTHHFAVSYTYQRLKSKMSPVTSHQAVLPAKPITDLTLTEEGIHLILKWGRPRINIVDSPLKELIGYHVYSQTKDGTQWTEEKRISAEPVLREAFEQQFSDSEGEFRFRVTALSAERIESDFSNPVSIRIVDTTPPQAPAALVCLSYDDHIILTWDGSPDKDLEQYRIFRKQSHIEPFTKLTEGIKTSFYRDYQVKKGQSYFYLVTALDTKGNESSESNMAEGKIE